MELRPYQEQMVSEIRANIAAGHKRVVGVLGCGGGKSVIAAAITKSATDKGNHVLFVVHRRELCQQIEETFVRCGVNMMLCHIGMVQTISRQIDRDSYQQGAPALVIVDEAHHSCAKTYTKILDKYSDAKAVGFTATPQRLGEGGLGAVYTAMVESVTTEWLIKNNYLSPYKYYSVLLASADTLHTRRGDYVQNEVAALMEKPKIYGDTVEHYKKLADGKKTIVYCASIAASKETAKAFCNAGITAEHLDGETPKDDREKSMARFRSGETTVLCNVDLFGEGLDIPDCECVILLRPTQSLTLHVQQSMRSMRYLPGKTAIIIDHVANYTRHGLPDDMREWTLETKKRKNRQSEIRVRECAECYAVVAAGCRECPECGCKFETVTESREPEQVIADLQEIRREYLRAAPYASHEKIKTFDGLVEFQKAKKYKFGWVIHAAKRLGIEIPSKYTYMQRYMGGRH